MNGVMDSEAQTLLENGTPGEPATAADAKASSVGPAASMTGNDYAAECARYDEVRRVAATGNGLRLSDLLAEWQEMGWLRDWRNEEGLTLYAEAIADGYSDIVGVLLHYDVPLGDALIRAIDVEFDDVTKSICQYLEERESLLQETLQGTSDNDDFHPSITPLILAAQRNNFATVKLLVGLGASIAEPSMSQGGDVTLTQAISTLHVYRALSQPAYILATQIDVFGHAFEMSAKVKLLSRTWEDFGAEYEKMADGIERFAAEILGQSSSTEEILALFRYHNTDKYRHADGKQHPLAKLFEAIKYQQKEFIAHPHCQKAIIVQFYRSLLDWNEHGLLHQILLLFVVLLGYPIICILYILVPVQRVVNFARLPYIMMMMKAGSGFTFLMFIIAVTMLGKHGYPRTTNTLHVLILIWIIGLAWVHLKLILMHGRGQYLSDSTNVHELVIMGLYLTVFVLQYLETGQGDPVASPVIQDLVDSGLDGLRGRVNGTVLDGVGEIITQALSGCRSVDSPDSPAFALLHGAGSPSSPALGHLNHLLESAGKDQFEPTVVAGALFGVTITVSVLRMMNLLLVSDSVGPLRISMGSMVADITKFLAIFMLIWFAFAVGLFQNFYSAGLSATRACLGEGNDPDSCHFLVGYSTFMASMKDLYWSLYGLTGFEILMLPGKHSVAEKVGTFLYQVYLIVAVLVLLNALVGMLSNTYNRTEEHADTEWKFHRTAVWAGYLRPVGTLPPPFNLIPSVKSLYRLYMFCTGVRRKVVNRKDVHFKKELEDYERVLKLVSTRYIQGNLSTESQNNESARPRDLQALRNDIMAFKFNVQDRLESVVKTLDITQNKTKTVQGKVLELDPLSYRTGELVDLSISVNDNVVTLFDETDSLQQRQKLEMTQRDMDAQQLRETIAKLRADAVELNGQYSREVERREQLEEETTRAIQDLQEDIKDLTDAARRLEEDKTKLTAEISELQDRIIISEGETKQLGKTIDALRDEMTDIKAGSAREMYEQLAKHKEAFNSLKGENKRFRETVDALNEEKAALTKTLSDMREENPSLPKQPSSLKYTITAHRVEIEKLTGRHAAEIDAKNQKEAQLQRTIRKLQEQKDESERKREKDTAELKNSISQLRVQMEKLRSVHSAETKETNQLNAELKDSNQGIREEKTVLEQTLSKLQDEKAVLAGLIRELNREFFKLKGQNVQGSLTEEAKGDQSPRHIDPTDRSVGLFGRLENIFGETFAANEKEVDGTSGPGNQSETD